MHDFLPLILAFAGGVALGAIHFTLLWFTVRNLAKHPHPQQRLMGSLVLRMVLLLGGFYLIMGDGNWQRLVAALAGFVAVRLVTVGRVERRIAATAGTERKTS